MFELQKFLKLRNNEDELASLLRTGLENLNHFFPAAIFYFFFREINVA
jgi:hypothetical protein